MAKKSMHVKEPNPVKPDPKRTPVSADLGAKVRAMDDALMAEFGFDLCYVIMSRDGIVAASNARDGYLPPIVEPASGG